MMFVFNVNVYPFWHSVAINLVFAMFRAGISFFLIPISSIVIYDEMLHWLLDGHRIYTIHRFRRNDNITRVLFHFFFFIIMILKMVHWMIRGRVDLFTSLQEISKSQLKKIDLKTGEESSHLIPIHRIMWIYTFWSLIKTHKIRY